MKKREFKSTDESRKKSHSGTFIEEKEAPVFVPVSTIKTQERLTRKIAVRMHQQEVVALLSQIALATISLDLKEFMEDAAMFAARTLNVEFSKILELNPDGKMLILRAGYGWKKDMVPDKTIFKSVSSIAGLTLVSKKPVVIKNLNDERNMRGFAHLRSHKIVSGMSVIIPSLHGPYGVIGVYTKEQRNFTEDDLNFLQSVANILALCFERTKADAERIKVENELRRFQYMADNANVGISLIDKEGNLQYANRVTYERLGLSREQYLKRRVVHVPEHGNVKDSSAFKKLFNTVQKKQLQPIETIELKADRKTSIPIELNLTGVKFEGKPFMFAVTQDITERQKAREVQKKIQGNLSFLAEASLILNSSLDYREILNSLARIAIPTVADWCAIDMLTPEGDLELVTVQHADPEKIEWGWKHRAANKVDMNAPTGSPNVVRTGKAELYSDVPDELLVQSARSKQELKILRYIGLKSVMIVPIKIGKRVLGVLTFIISGGERRYDKDDLAIAEELANRAALAIENSKLYSTIEEQKIRLDNIIANMPGIVWENWLIEKPELQRITFISDYTEKMLCYPPSIWKKPGFLRSVIHTDDLERVTGEYEQMIREKKGVVQRFRLIRKDGSVIWAESHSSIIFGDKGEVLGLRGVIMDVSEQAEFELRKDEFISMASHELKTPITTLKVFTQILRKQAEKQGDENMTVYLSKMDAQISRLTDLINDLLDLSKIQTGKISFTVSTFKIDELVREIVEQIQPTTDNHTINIIGGTKHMIRGDRDRIGQVLINLLTNAVKYSPRADKINVYLSEDDKEIHVGVEDYGIGLSPEQKEKIFDRFYQVTDGDQKTFPGLGIGLYIADQIVRRHGGKINVSSDKGKWSLFDMVLPRKHALVPMSI